jgi:LacI family transcriptional regulator
MTNKPMKVTIREVAAHAGVSMQTVTRVMRNERYVGEATRAAVERAIAELNYTPMQSARNLSANVPRVVGLVVPHATEMHGSDRTGAEYFHGLHLGALQCCRERRYGLQFAVPAGRDGAEELVARVHSREVGGYVVPAPATEIEGLLEALEAQGIPYAAISPLKAPAGAAVVAADERSAVRALTRHLIELGHRRIAFAGGEGTSRAGVERPAGYREAMKEAGLRVERRWVTMTGLGYEAGQAAGERLLHEADRPSAFVSITDDAAAGVIAVAHAMGLRLPQALSVAGFNNVGLSRKIWPPLTTADLPVERLGALATQQLIERLDRGAAPEPVPPMACELVLRASTIEHRE